MSRTAVLTAIAGTGFLLMPTLGLLWTHSMTAVFIAMGLGLIACVGWPSRRLPPPDRALAWAFAGLLLCATASAAWALEPQESLDRTLRLVFAFLPLPFLFSQRVGAAFAAVRSPPHALLAFGLLAVAVPLALDHVFDFPVYRLLHGVSHDKWTRPDVFSDSVHNRAISYFVVLAWPAMAYAWVTGRRLLAAAFPVAAMVLAALGASSAAVLACGMGFIALTMGALAPHSARRAVAVLVVLWAGLGPFGALGLGNDLTSLGGLPHSALHRLEIYHFAAHRLIERPLLGWGIENTRFLPVNEEELPNYSVFDLPPTHPHNGFVQAWIELGLPGFALAVTFALIPLLRIGRLPRAVQPPALAAYASAITIWSLSYSIWSGSWLVTLLLCALCFFALPGSAGTSQRAAGPSAPVRDT